MLGNKIKTLRIKNSLTQKELAEKLYVTAQAVSRWENNEVEPSIATLTEIAKIFNISIGELLGEDNILPKEKVEKRILYKEQKPVLAVCHHCNKPIYDGKEIVRKKSYNGRGSEEILCSTCDAKIKKQKHDSAVRAGLRRRKNSFLWGGIFTGLIMIVGLIITRMLHSPVGVVIGVTLGGALFFPFIACLYLDNNFIIYMVGAVAMWSFRLPGLIFELSLDGIIWLLTVKLLFWILGGLVSVFCFILSIVLGIIAGLFVYPFALDKNIRHPEITEK